MNLELKISVEDVRQFYTGELGKEFLEKISTEGRLEKGRGHHLNVFFAPLMMIADLPSIAPPSYLRRSVGPLYGRFQDAVESAATVLRNLAEAATDSYLTMQRHPDLDRLALEHWQQFSVFAAAYAPLSASIPPKNELKGNFLGNLTALVAVANTLYSPKTGRELISHITSEAVLDASYLERLCASSIQPAKTL